MQSINSIQIKSYTNVCKATRASMYLSHIARIMLKCLLKNMAYNKKRLEELLGNTADLSLKRKARRIIEEVNPKPSDKILEVGSGDAYYPALFARLGKFYVVGLELDTRVINTAERNFKKLSLPYKRLKKWRSQKLKQTYIVEGDVMKLP